ncbi:hypothetical protein [Verrucomicrobium spinosum]|uniref:hypothetical protein n=2 Tax=Verrucomicrobium spinosum TaxID=2736 RepID=UPI0001745146|nr:hypothetical protein [Verrucomicrobium spinosum]
MNLKLWFKAFFLLLLGAFITIDLAFSTGLTAGCFAIAMHTLLGGISFAMQALPHAFMSWTNLALASGVAVGLLAWIAAIAFHSQRNHTDRPRRFQRAFMILGGLASLIIGSFAAVNIASASILLVRDGVGAPDRGWMGESIGKARQLNTALRIYASEHNGAYPLHLSDVVASGILSQQQFDRLSLAALSDGIPVPWIYFGGLHESLPGTTPLLMHPLPSHGGKRIVALNDSSVSLLISQDYDDVVKRWRELASQSK